MLSFFFFCVTCILFHSKPLSHPTSCSFPYSQCLAWVASFGLDLKLVQLLVCHYTIISHQFPGICSRRNTCVLHIICLALFPRSTLGSICDYKSWLLQALYSQLPGVLTRVTLIDHRKFLQHQVSTSTLKAFLFFSSLPIFSPFVPSLLL